MHGANSIKDAADTQEFLKTKLHDDTLMCALWYFGTPLGTSLLLFNLKVGFSYKSFIIFMYFIFILYSPKYPCVGVYLISVALALCHKVIIASVVCPSAYSSVCHAFCWRLVNSFNVLYVLNSLLYL